MLAPSSQWEERYWYFPWFAQRELVAVQVPGEFLKAVVFIGTKTGNRFTPKATGFLVMSRHVDFTWVYVVTAEHVISGLAEVNKGIFVRINTKNGPAVDFEIPLREWYFHPDETNRSDVAVSFFHRPPTGIEFDFKAFNLDPSSHQIATKQVIKNSYIGPGEEIAILGLFRSHCGTDHNIPIVRIGNISLMHDEPVHTRYCGYTDAYLIEARSIAGLSGSPVVTARSPVAELPNAADVQRWTANRYLLLGLMHGHYDVENLAEDLVVDDANGGSINTGIGVVIPVEKILDTIAHPDLVRMREEIMKVMRNSKGATPDMPGEDDLAAAAEKAKEPNPQHREDFTALLGEAARKRPQDG